MHPILGHRERLGLYLAPWLFVALGIAGATVWATGTTVGLAGMLTLPLTAFLAFICLGAWYPSRSNPLRGSTIWQVMTVHLLAATLSTGLWQALGLAWASLLARTSEFAPARDLFLEVLPVLVGLGALFYLLTASAAYLFLAIQAHGRAERETLVARQEQELARAELDLARSLQRRLLPAAEIDDPAFSLSARNRAARGVAGDFYDHFRLADGTLRIAVADVAGKGMAASLIMATVKAVLPMVAEDRSVAETMDLLNERLCGQLARREFVALVLAAFDPETGRVEIANAGVPDAWVLRPGGDPEPVEVDFPRLPLGLRRDLRYRTSVTRLEAGERLVLFTDGLPEAPVEGGAPLGYERLATSLPEPEADRWLDRWIDAVRAVSTDESADDWTVVSLLRR